MTLQEQLKQELDVNESKTRFANIQQYLSAWTYEQFDEADAKAFLKAITDGMKEGLDDRKLYGTAEKYMKTTEMLEKVWEAFSKSIPR